MSLLTDLLRFEVNEKNLPIRAEQLRARMKVYPMMLLAEMAVAPLFAALFWHEVSQPALLLWLATIVMVHAGEVFAWWRTRRRISSIEDCHKWHRIFVGFAMLVGLTWGFAPIWFFPADFAYQALMITILLGLASGGVTMNPVHPPSLYAYTASVLLPLILRVAAEGDSTHLLLAAMMTVYLGVVLNAGRQLSVTFRRTLDQRYENEILVGALLERKRDAEASRQVAEQANRAKSRFLATASHDLRQPLQALRLFSDALQDTAREKETVHLAGQIGKSVNALVNMFDDLLDVSRLDAGIVEPRQQHFMLGPLFDRIYGDFAPIAQAKGLNFQLSDCMNCNGKNQCNVVIYSDPFLLERMLRNLISNAIRYTDSGGVVVRRTCLPNKVTLEVFDTGIGIRPETLPHIFEEYYQADNPHRDRRKGLGLGLAIVRRIEELLDCRVQVSSEPGVGSVFSFDVPRGDSSNLAQPFVITHSHYDLSDSVVVLVEDDQDIREQSVELMEQWRCKVFAGEHAEDVMRRLDISELRPDLLVCDYRLPHGVTAIHVIERMRELWGNGLPAVVLTGDTARETLQAIHASGAILLHKPIAPARLRAMMYFALHGES